jgi:hypothetical protein
LTRKPARDLPHHPNRLDVDALLRQAFAEQKPAEDFDAALRRLSRRDDPKNSHEDLSNHLISQLDSLICADRVAGDLR